MKNRKQNPLQKSALIALTLSLASVSSLHAATDNQAYVKCFSSMNLSRLENNVSAEDMKNSNSYSLKFLGAILSKLPRSWESEVLKLVGAGPRDMQSLKSQLAEGGAVAGDSAEADMNAKLNVAYKTYYAYDPADDRYLIVITPEGKVLETQISEKGIGSEKVNIKFSIQDSQRHYFFAINHDVKCKKDCDNYLWLVDSAPYNKNSIPTVAIKNFPQKISREITGSVAQEMAREVLESEVKYGLAKLVGVEKAQKLPGIYLLPDPQDTSKYNREKFSAALQSCEKDLKASGKDTSLIGQALAMLR